MFSNQQCACIERNREQHTLFSSYSFGTENRTTSATTRDQQFTFNLVTHISSVTHSLTSAFDWLRVVAISTISGPGLRTDRHWWVDPYLLPPVEAKFFVDGSSSQWQVCRWRHQWIDVINSLQTVIDVSLSLFSTVNPTYNKLDSSLPPSNWRRDNSSKGHNDYHLVTDTKQCSRTDVTVHSDGKTKCP